MPKSKQGANTPQNNIPQEPPVNVLEDGYIDPTYYYNASIDIIERIATDQQIDLQKADTNRINYLLSQCFKILYARNKQVWTNKHSIIPYEPENIKRLMNVYLDIVYRYNALPSLAGFVLYSGIDENTARRYEEVTGVCGLVRNSRKNYIQNRLNNTPIGVMTLANNDIETGLLYTRQNIVTHEAVKRSLSFDDLKKIADNGADDSNNC